MTAETPPPDATPPSDAHLAACLCAIDPAGLGGVVARGRAGPMRDRWLGGLRALLPAGAPVRRLPSHADEQRLFGGLDLAATLATGRPVTARGLLAEADGGVVVAPMAERIPAALAARLGLVLDAGAIGGHPARLGLVLLDEGIEPEEQPPVSLRDRLAFWLDLDAADPSADGPGAAEVLAARTHYAAVTIDDGALEALCGTAEALGVASLRGPILAVRAARAAAALAGRPAAGMEDAALAARLVLAPRATRLPAAATDPAPDPAPPPPPDPAEGEAETPPAPQADDTGPPADLVLAAAAAAIPPGLLAQLQGAAARGQSRRTQGRAGAPTPSNRRGRPAGARAGLPGGGARLDVIATLRAAAPWQRLRPQSAGRVAIRRDDLRIARVTARGETATLFVVDASGSLAVARLAEAKGAVLALLADCYVRRDEVALLAFRGEATALLLPPTRSLARARRCLADLPGGGATPLASAIDAAVALAETVRRRGRTPVVVFLTDGRGNVSRTGTRGRPEGEADAALAAAAAAAAGLRMLVIDAAARPQAPARTLAAALRATYLALPYAEPTAVARAVVAASAP